MNICIIQARMAGTRLPRKVLMEVKENTPMLEYGIQRVLQSKLIDIVVVATSVSKENDELEAFCKERRIGCFRGSEEDVLDRFYKCSQKYSKYDTIVRITGDCPLIDSKVIDDVVMAFQKGECVYASNVIEPTFPDGIDVEVFSKAILEQAHQSTTMKSQREHVTPYMRLSKTLPVAHVRAEKNYSHLRLTVDNVEDLDVIRFLIRNSNIDSGYKHYVQLLEKNPDVKKQNENFERDIKFKKDLKNDYEF